MIKKLVFLICLMAGIAQADPSWSQTVGAWNSTGAAWKRSGGGAEAYGYPLIPERLSYLMWLEYTNSAATTLTDNSYNDWTNSPGMTATNVGSAWRPRTNGVASYYDMNGPANYHFVADDPLHDPGGTMSCGGWFKATSSEIQEALMVHDLSAYKWLLWIDTSSDSPRLYITTASGVTYTELLADDRGDDLWHHIVGVYDKGASDGRIKLYIDGYLVATNAVTTYNEDVSAGDEGIYMCSDFNGTADGFQGLWTKPFYTRTALSGDNVLTLFRQQRISTTSNIPTTTTAPILGGFGGVVWEEDNWTLFTNSCVLAINFDTAFAAGGNVQDASIQQNHGVNGATTAGATQEGSDTNGYVSFDGGDTLTIPQDTSYVPGTDDFSISYWVYIDDWAGYRVLFDQDGGSDRWTIQQDNTQATNGWLFLLEDSGSAIQYRMFTDDATNTWIHHCWTADRSGNMLLYTNGVLHNDSWDISSKSGDITPTDSMKIGRRDDAGGLNWKGDMDTFRIFKGTNLTAAEALDIYNYDKDGNQGTP